MKLKTAHILAENLMRQLAPFCERIEIGGSIRRKKEEVKDIELICIAKKVIDSDEGSFDLFGEPETKVVEPKVCSGFIEQVNQWTKVKGEPTGKYTQRIIYVTNTLPNEPTEIKLDLFMATPENYGNVMLIRTGDWEFSKKFMGVVIRKAGYVQEDGYLKKTEGGEIIPMYEEKDMFDFFKVPYIEPENRNVNAL